MDAKKKNCRVLHFIDSEGVYGAERVILNLSQKMKEDEKYMPVIACIVDDINDSSPLYDAATDLNIEAIKIPIKNSEIFWKLFSISRKFKEKKIDLIHAHGYKPAVYAFIIFLIAKIKVLSTCHLWFDVSNAPMKMKVLVKIEKFFYRWYPIVVAVSDEIARVLHTAGVPKNKIKVVRNGVPLESESVNAADLQKVRDEFAISDQTICLLNTARLDPQKAQWIIVEAVKILKDQGREIKALIVGEGLLKQELKERIEALGLESDVFLTGYRSDIAALLEVASVFVLPSIDEGMPMSLLEAVRSKIPVVCTDVGDIGKLISSNESGLIVPMNQPKALAEAVDFLCESKGEAETLANTAYLKFIERYSSHAMYCSYEEIYQSILSA